MAKKITPITLPADLTLNDLRVLAFCSERCHASPSGLVGYSEVIDHFERSFTPPILAFANLDKLTHELKPSLLATPPDNGVSDKRRLVPALADNIPLIYEALREAEQREGIPAAQRWPEYDYTEEVEEAPQAATVAPGSVIMHPVHGPCTMEIRGGKPQLVPVPVVIEDPPGYEPAAPSPRPRAAAAKPKPAKPAPKAKPPAKPAPAAAEPKPRKPAPKPAQKQAVTPPPGAVG